MSQTSSGPPAIELSSPVSPPMQEQGINDNDLQNTEMNTTQSVTREDLANNYYLLKHPAPKRNTEPTLEHYLSFEELLKEAATITDKVHKFSSAAQNVRSPTWEKSSIQIEECSKRIRAICTFLLPSYQLKKV
ncbi:hypothetical protein CDAR_221911 [Caerostris darwini]|uniref:Uncharacterized protein n=1 Tax=Caerostris darwini TaxID=1538125 RepID=A0AAV4WZT5_9ARAC|nr:hypothetical protein CDAR_221911 [Caerostris darwini]